MGGQCPAHILESEKVMQNFIKGILFTLPTLVQLNQFWQSTSGSIDQLFLQGYLGFAILCLCVVVQCSIIFSLKGNK